MPHLSTSRRYVIGVVALSFLPLLLGVLDLEVASAASGSVVHSLLEWSAVCACVFTVGLGFLYVRVKANLLVATIGLAAFASGLCDGLHTLASLELIPTASTPERFIPFTWAISRFAKISVLGVGVWLVLIQRAPSRRMVGRFIATGAAAIAIVAAGLLLGARTDALPEAYYEAAFVTRPWDLPALLLLAALAVFLYPRLLRTASGFLPGALALSAAPDLLAQVHTSFLSVQLYDFDFQAAHALKLLAALVLCVGLSTDFVRGFRTEAQLVSRLERAVKELQGVERELLKTEDRFRQLTENIRQVFWLSDQELQQIDYVSPAYEELFGLSSQSLYDDPASFLKVVHPDDREMMEKLFAARIRQHFQVDYRIVQNGRRIRWVRTRGFPIRSAAGRVRRLAGLSEDITEQREAQDAQWASEARIRALFAATPDLLFRIDREGRMVDYHARDKSVLYLEPDQFLGKKVTDVFPSTMGTKFRENVDETLENNTMPTMEYQLLGRDGIQRDFEARFVLSTDDEVLIVVRDITERKRLERELLSVSNREQQRIGHDLHDGLSQELTGAALLLQAVQQKLRRKGLSEADDVRQIEDVVQTAVSHTRTLARGLAPVLLEAGGLSAALEELASGVEQLHPVRCSLCVLSDPSELSEATSVHLYRIAQEAVTNALKHASPKHIVITLNEKDHRLRLSIEDDGTGLDTKAAALHEGMGLHIMRYRARMINASLEVSDRASGGTIVVCEGIAPLDGGTHFEPQHAEAPADKGSSSEGP